MMKGPTSTLELLMLQSTAEDRSGPRLTVWHAGGSAFRPARPGFGGWPVSHGGVANVLRRAGLGRRLARLAAAESLAASEGGPLTERVLREVRSIERAKPVHIGSGVPRAEL